jgi:hypothetical protein
VEAAEVLIEDAVESHPHVLVLTVYLLLRQVEGRDHLSLVSHDYVGLADEGLRVVVENDASDQLHPLPLELAYVAELSLLVHVEGVHKNVGEKVAKLVGDDNILLGRGELN